MIRALFFCISLSIFSLFAEEQILIQKLRGIVLVPGDERIESVDSDFSGVIDQGVDVPGGVEVFYYKVGKKFLDKPLTKNSLLALKTDVVLYYRKKGYPIVLVEIPEQSLSDSFIHLRVIEGKLGELTIQGNEWYSDKLFCRGVHVQQGEVISDEFLNDVAWLNRNPFHNTEVVFSPGKKEGTTDIEMITQDRFPLRPYIGGDNTGTDITGNARWFIGATWGNVFGCDQILTYQFTASSDFHKLLAHTAHYVIPLPIKHNLVFFGAYAKVHPDITDFTSDGYSGQVSIRYEIPIKPLFSSLTRQWTFGFDFKRTNNNLQFVSLDAAALVSKTVNITQWLLGFNIGNLWRYFKTQCNVDLYISPGKWIADQSDQNYGDLRPGANASYTYFRAWNENTVFMPYNFSTYLMLRGQIATDKLLPSEQFGLGGYDTVRGYDERIINADNAFCLNFEIRLPPFRVLRFLKKYPDSLEFLGFLDYGVGRDIHDEFSDLNPGELQTSQHLLSVGPGLRYKITRFLIGRVDWGFRLHGTQFQRGHGSKVHLGIIASY